MSHSTALTPDPGAPATQSTTAGGPDEPARTSGSRRLLWSLSGSQFGVYLVFGAVPSVLLALQISNALGDKHKAAALAVITTIGALVHALWLPVAGLLSDRTRTRWGSRTPWAVGGALAAVPVLWLMGLTSSVWLLGVLFVLVEVTLASAEGTMSAVVPDRVVPRSMGRFSAARGLGVMVGTAAGQALGGVLGKNLTFAYLLLGILPILFVCLRLVLDPDADNRDRPETQSMSLRALAGTYRVDVRSHPDFWWSWVSRFLTYLGFFAVYGYTLYIFQDYVGLGDDAPPKVSLYAIVGVVGLVVSTLPAGALSDRIGRRKVFVLVSSVGIGISFMIPLVWPTTAGMLVEALVAGVAFGCYQAVDLALITQVLPQSSSHGQYLGISSLASILPQVAAPAVAGAVVVLTGGYTALFPVAAAFTVLGALTILRVRSVR
jgi:MFS family permease